MTAQTYAAEIPEAFTSSYHEGEPLPLEIWEARLARANRFFGKNAMHLELNTSAS